MKRSPAIIRETCVEYFGRYDTKRGWSPPNRCDQCPIGKPCRDHGLRIMLSHTFEALKKSRVTFVREALVILRRRA